MDEETLINELTDLLFQHDEVCRVRTYEEAGLLTSNNGLVLSMQDGSVFQLTIVKSR